MIAGPLRGFSSRSWRVPAASRGDSLLRSCPAASAPVSRLTATSATMDAVGNATDDRRQEQSAATRQLRASSAL